MVDTDNIPVVLQAPKVDPTVKETSFNPIGKKWKIFIGSLFFVNTLIFFHTAYLYYAFHDRLALLALAIQSDLLSVLAGFVGILINIAVLVVYFYFRKRRTQERADIPTNRNWKALFAGLTIFYILLAGLLMLLSGAIMFGLSVITDTIVASFNVMILLIYFDRHKPRKLFQVIGNIIIYLSLVFIIVGIILQSLSTISFFIGG